MRVAGSVVLRIVLMGVGLVAGANVGAFVGGAIGIGVDAAFFRTPNGEPVLWGLTLGTVFGAVGFAIAVALLLRGRQ